MPLAVPTIRSKNSPERQRHPELYVPRTTAYARAGMPRQALFNNDGSRRWNANHDMPCDPDEAALRKLVWALHIRDVPISPHTVRVLGLVVRHWPPVSPDSGRPERL